MKKETFEINFFQEKKKNNAVLPNFEIASI